MEHSKSSRSHRWHPKISPYRLIVFATSLILGTLKTLGCTSTPTALEWVGSTILSILLFSVSNYDNNAADQNASPPVGLNWLFSPDCMDLVWSSLSCFSVSRPYYTSDEKISHMLSYPHPPITAYRILVSTVVIVFGFTKAGLSYQGVLSPTTQWIDWAMAVPLFVILYSLGLYEYNSANVMFSFFVVDRTSILLSVVTGVLYILALLLSATWIYIFAYGMSFFSYHPSLFSELRNSGLEAVGTFWKILAHEFLLAGVMAGVLMFLLIFRKAVMQMSDERGIIQRVSRMMCRAIIGKIQREMSPPRYEKGDAEYEKDKDGAPPPGVQTPDAVQCQRPRFFVFIDLIMYTIVHLCTYMFGIALCLTLQLPGSPFFIRNVLTTLTSDPDPSPFGTSVFAITLTWGLRAFGLLFSVSFSLSMMVGMALGSIAMAILMIEPFWSAYFHGAGRGLYGRIDTLKERLIGLGPFECLL